jgi:osmotically-inducible protein OsmY
LRRGLERWGGDVAVNRTDYEIADGVRHALEQHLGTEARRLRVTVVAGVVRLQGVVNSPEKKAIADELAWRALGTRDVVNEIVVGPTSLTAGTSA